MDAAGRERRFKLFSLSSITIDGRERRAHVLNVSLRGAQLHCVVSPRVGSWVAIACGPVIASGEVRWVDEQGRIGVKFTYQLSQQMLDDMRGSTVGT